MTQAELIFNFIQKTATLHTHMCVYAGNTCKESSNRTQDLSLAGQRFKRLSNTRFRLLLVTVYDNYIII